jgi:hypothetical protein
MRSSRRPFNRIDRCCSGRRRSATACIGNARAIVDRSTATGSAGSWTNPLEVATGVRARGPGARLVRFPPVPLTA